MQIREIIERKDLVVYLEKRNLLKKYKKAKDFLVVFEIDTHQK